MLERLPSEQLIFTPSWLVFMHIFSFGVFQVLQSILSPLFQFVGTVLRSTLLLTIAFGMTLGVLSAPVQADPLVSTILSGSSVPAALPGLGQFFAGTAPANLGLQDDRLSPCPPSPNCILSQDSDPAHSIAPLAYHSDRSRAYDNLLKVLSVVPRTRIVTQTDNYIRVEFESRLLGFVDDGEFYFPAEDSIIQVRSASRLGESDLGVNRTRMEQIRLALQDLEERTAQ